MLTSSEQAFERPFKRLSEGFAMSEGNRFCDTNTNSTDLELDDDFFQLETPSNAAVEAEVTFEEEAVVKFRTKDQSFPHNVEIYGKYSTGVKNHTFTILIQYDGDSPDFFRQEELFRRITNAKLMDTSFAHLFREGKEFRERKPTAFELTRIYQMHNKNVVCVGNFPTK